MAKEEQWEYSYQHVPGIHGTVRTIVYRRKKGTKLWHRVVAKERK